jgi:hypothetical protein
MACELTRQATYWALLAEREVRTPRQGDLPGPRERPTFAELWPGANASVIALAAGGEAEADFLGSHVRETSLAAFADMDRAQCMRITLGLRRVARALLSEVDASDREIDRIWMRRILRIGGVLVLGAAVAIAATSTMNWLERRRDVAHGRPWTASSNFGSGGCQSPVQSCSDSPTFFFHTQEEANPSFTIDLESVQRVSGVHVVNRGDCCLERAVPLVVEVSLDQKVWQRVAQRTAEFSDWKATFRTIPARWVRLTVERRTMLHLQEVRVLR